MGRDDRVLLLSSSTQLREPVSTTLRSAGYEVFEAQTANEARTWLRGNRVDIGIIDLGATCPGGSIEVLNLVSTITDSSGGSFQSLLLARPDREPQLRALFDEHRLRNFITVGENEALDPIEVAVTVSKILNNDIFGLDRYLSEILNERSFTIRSSDEKTSVIAATEDFATESGCNTRISQQIATAVDELITNAIYNAPVDSKGYRRYAHIPRQVPILLEPNETIRIRIATDGRRIGLSALDPFGSLTADRVVDYLAKCYLGGDNQIDSKEGGAGLGLYFLFNLLNSFVINIAPGRATEVIGLIEISKSFRTFAKRAKSFNIFVERSERQGI